MVTKIISGRNIRGVLNYNENKVEKGKPKLLKASGFLEQEGSLSFIEKIASFSSLHSKTKGQKRLTIDLLQVETFRP